MAFSYAFTAEAVSFKLDNTFASDVEAESNINAFNKDDFDEFKISFSEHALAVFTNGTLKHTVEFDRMLSNQQRVSKAQDMIIQIQLDTLGLTGAEEYYLNKLNGLYEDDLILEDYAIYVPQGSSWVNFGSYNGVPMVAIYDVYNIQYQRTSTNESDISKWVEGIVNILMSFGSPKISIPYAIISSIQDPLVATTGPIVNVTSREEVTSRVVYCQDVYGRWGPTSAYIGALADMAKVADEIVAFYPNSPYAPATLTGSKRQTVSTPNFFNQSTIRVAAYNQYAFGAAGEMDVRHLPLATLLFQ